MAHARDRPVAVPQTPPATRAQHQQGHDQKRCVVQQEHARARRQRLRECAPGPADPASLPRARDTGAWRSDAGAKMRPRAAVRCTALRFPRCPAAHATRNTPHAPRPHTLILAATCTHLPPAKEVVTRPRFGSVSTTTLLSVQPAPVAGPGDWNACNPLARRYRAPSRGWAGVARRGVPGGGAERAKNLASPRSKFFFLFRECAGTVQYIVL